MERNYISPVSSLTSSLESVYSTSLVPKSIVRIMAKFGPRVAIAIAINRLRYRVKCRILYSIDLLRTLQNNYHRLKASKVRLWMIRKSVASPRLSTLIWRIEMHFRGDCSGTFTEKVNSKRLEKQIALSSFQKQYYSNF